MTEDTPRLGLPFLAAAQAQKHVTINEALGRLDALVMLSFESRQLASEPAAPAEGAAWLVPAGAQGPNWRGIPAGAIAVFADKSWRAITPQAGFRAYIRDERAFVVYDGAAWTPIGGGAPSEVQNLTRFGLATTADSVNPFAVKLNKALWTARTRAEGGQGDLRYTLNKEGAGDVLSLLLQSGFSGRAEIGLVGDEDLSFRTSQDGVNFAEAARLRRSDNALLAANPQFTALNSGPLAGFRNRIINGDFRINQRAFAGGAIATGVYGHDRWRASGASNYTVSTANPALVTLNSGALAQAIEDVNFNLAGQSVTISVGGASSQPISVTLAANQSGSGSVSGTIQSGSGRRGVTLTVPATMTGGALLTLSGNGASFGEVMLTPGTAVESYFERRPASVEELACRRYFQALIDLIGNYFVANVIFVPVSFQVPMRAAASVTANSGATFFFPDVITDSVTLAFASISARGGFLYLYSANTRPANTIGAVGGGGLWFSAEL